jgi:hypothetical protein
MSVLLDAEVRLRLTVKRRLYCLTNAEQLSAEQLSLNCF